MFFSELFSMPLLFIKHGEIATELKKSFYICTVVSLLNFKAGHNVYPNVHFIAMVSF